MKKIDNNAKPLSQLVTNLEFFYYFTTIDDMNNYSNIFNTTNEGVTYMNPIANVFYALGGTSQANLVISGLLNMLYDIFADAIPYNQTLETITIAAINPDGTTNAKQVQLPNALLRNIRGYITAYMPSILSWSYGMYRMIIAQQKVLNGTRTVSKSASFNNVSQNQNINKNSFNPVETGTTITTNKITVNTQSNGGLQAEQFTANNSANWSTDTNGSSSETTRDENITEYDLTQLRELGSEKAVQYLMPLFKKIGTLFWQLGNDYWNEDKGDFGFNIW